MAARSRRRVSRVRLNGGDANGCSSAKVNAAEALQLGDVMCCVCRGVLVEPVSLPCRHRFCRECWLATDALRCPLCRTRVGSWLRESARRNVSLVDEELWGAIRTKFPEELARKLKGEDVDLEIDSRPQRLSAPGEIRAEYEAEVQRRRAERLQLEQQHTEETERLVRKLQEEEETAHKVYLEKIKSDEQLAKQLQFAPKRSFPNGSLSKTVANGTKFATKNKRATLDRYLIKKTLPKQPHLKNSPLITDDDTGSSAASSVKAGAGAASPELVPSYGRFLQSYLDKKLRNLTGSTMPQNNGATVKTWVPPSDAKDLNAQKEFSVGGKPPIRTKGAQKQLCPIVPILSFVQSVPVSLPYAGRLNRQLAERSGVAAKCSAGETDSVDSMSQEMYHFKPIHPTATTSRDKNKLSDVVRVLATKGALAIGTSTPEERHPPAGPPDYLKGLHQLRGLHAHETPSAFVCLSKLLQQSDDKCDISEVKSKSKKNVDDDLPSKNEPPKATIYCTRKERSSKPEPGSKSVCVTRLRQTRSTSSIPKLVNDINPKQETPKKKEATAGRKFKSKSETKNPSKDSMGSPVIVSDPVIDYRKVSLVAKKLSSPLGACGTVLSSEDGSREPAEGVDYDMESNNNNTAPRKSKRRVSSKSALVEGLGAEAETLAAQTRAEALLEQERRDLELARRLQAEWDDRRPARATAKRRLCRQLTLTQLKKMKA